MSSLIYWITFLVTWILVISQDCPEGQEHVVLRCEASYEGQYKILSMDEVVLIYDILTFSYVKEACFKPGNYFIDMMVIIESTPRWVAPLNLYDSTDHLIESFIKTSKTTQRERFTIGDVITRESTFKYIHSKTIDENWMKKDFNDQSWKEGKNGTWEPAEPDTISYFRKLFDIPHPQQYSTILIQMFLQSSATLYLNGNELRQFIPSHPLIEPTQTSLYIPSSFLTSGSNILCVKINSQSSSSSTLFFSSSLHLITTQCLIPSHEGIASDDSPKPDPKYPASAAFGLGGRSWRTTILPVNLNLILANDNYFMPFEVTFSLDSNYLCPPKDVQIFGLVWDNSKNATIIEEEIGSANHPTFFELINSETIHLSPKRPYNAFRIHFKRDNFMTVVISKIYFSVCQQASCPKTRKYAETPLDGRIWTRCPFGYYGRNQQICRRQDVEATWIEDRSMCLRRFAHSHEAYIDLEMRTYGLRLQNKLRATIYIANHLLDHIPVSREQITFPYIVDSINEKYEFVIDIIMRLTVEAEAGSYVFKKVNTYLPRLKKDVKKDANFLHIKSFELGKLKLIKPLQWPSLVSWFLGCCILFIVGFTIAYYKNRSKHNTNGAILIKQLKKASPKTGSLFENLCAWNVSLNTVSQMKNPFLLKLLRITTFSTWRSEILFYPVDMN